MTASPWFLPCRPHAFATPEVFTVLRVRLAFRAVDPLSDVLRAVRLNGAFFYKVEAGAPWSVSAQPAADLLPRIMPGAEHLIPYHILLSGTCWGGLMDESQVEMRPGDVIMFPHGDPHFMSSASGGLLAPGLDAPPPRFPETQFLGPSAERDTTFVCGFLGCDLRPFNPLIASLPRCLHVPGIALGWLGEFPRQVIAETQAGRVGSQTVLTRMAELMFIEVVRRQVERLPAEQSGWLAGLRDPVVGPALSQLHARPADKWTLVGLARSIATSRTVLADRFSQVVGVPPMQYLARWRIQLAAGLLTSGASKVAAIAARVGYDSEAAFSRAFKRETGVSPAAWRRARQG